MERDADRGKITPEQYISTHTLTWSVTELSGVSFSEIDISTHTLTWSVTNILEQHTYTIEISTHTLTWSVTVRPPAVCVRCGFQLTRSRGA